MDTNRPPLLQPILDLGQGTLLVLKAVAGAPRLLTHRDSRRAFADQLYLCGISTLPVLTVTAIFMGMILALETGIELQRWSQEEYIASAVMVSMLREMGPFLSALVMAACVGSSIAAQLGTMAVNEELSALELMSIDPIGYLATPRIWAMALMMPLLSFCACMFGLLGGAAVGTTQLNVDWRLYFQVAPLGRTQRPLGRTVQGILLRGCYLRRRLPLWTCHDRRRDRGRKSHTTLRDCFVPVDSRDGLHHNPLLLRIRPLTYD